MQGAAKARTPPISGELVGPGKSPGAASKAALGGFLTLGSGIIGVIYWALMMSLWPPATDLYGIALPASTPVLGAIGILFSLVALVGGWFGYHRENWNLATVGGFLGFLSFGFGLGSLSGLLGLIFTLLGKTEFQ